MKREIISEAMGNISSRYIEEAFDFKTEEKPRFSKMILLKWASLATCFCLIVIVAFEIIPSLNNRTRPNYGDSGGGENEIADSVLPTDIDKIVWSNHLGSNNNSDEGYLEWNGFSVDTLLYDALQNYSDEYIAVTMTRANGQKIEESEYNQILENTVNRDYKNDSLYIFITRNQFLNWGLENKTDYIFYLASRDIYEGTVSEAPTANLDNSVVGFAYEKFKFSNNEGNTAKSDAEVFSLMNALIDQWKYTYDCIEITLYTHISEEELEALNYSGIMQLKYPDRTVIQVKYVNVNMGALKELSKRSDVSVIYISAPSTSIEEEPTVDG